MLLNVIIVIIKNSKVKLKGKIYLIKNWIRLNFTNETDVSKFQPLNTTVKIFPIMI